MVVINMVYVLGYTQSAGVFCTMPHPPPHIWACRRDQSLHHFIYVHFIQPWQELSQNNKLRILWTSSTSLAAVLHVHVRLKRGPLTHRPSSSAWGTWTSTVSMPDAGMVTLGTSGSICSMGNSTE